MNHNGSMLVSFFGLADDAQDAHDDAIERANEYLDNHTDSVVQAMTSVVIDTRNGQKQVCVTLAVLVSDKSRR